jgi:hypothetical protein
MIPIPVISRREFCQCLKGIADEIRFCKWRVIPDTIPIPAHELLVAGFLSRLIRCIPIAEFRGGGGGVGTGRRGRDRRNNRQIACDGLGGSK